MQVPDTGLPVGTLLVYNAQIDESLWTLVKTGIGTADGLFQALRQPLQDKWGLAIVSSNYNGWTFGAEPITLTLQMTGPETYAQPDDVRSIVDGEIINALGSNPITSSNISSWTIPASAGGTGQTVDTGAPAASVGGGILGGVANTLGIDSSSIGNVIKNATSGFGLGTGIIVIVLGIVAIFAVVVVLEPTAPGRAARSFSRGRR